MLDKIEKHLECLLFVDAQGQRVLEAGLQQPRQRIKSTISGVYSQNATLFFRNSPYYVDAELIVDSEATLTIETGVQIYFATGVGLKVYGTIMAIVSFFFCWTCYYMFKISVKVFGCLGQ